MNYCEKDRGYFTRFPCQAVLWCDIFFILTFPTTEWHLPTGALGHVRLSEPDSEDDPLSYERAKDSSIVINNSRDTIEHVEAIDEDTLDGEQVLPD